MKTAMQELIDDLKKLKRDSKENDSTGTFEIGMNFAIARAERRLEKEKEQIIEAFDFKRNNSHLTGFDDEYIHTGAEYYTRIYKQND